MRHPVVKQRGAPAAAGETNETLAGTSGRRRFAWTATALLPLLPLFGYLLLGDLVWSLKERAVQELVKAQLREFSQHPVLLNILFGALPALLALAAGPPIGAWSDRTRTRWGRRIPFLLVCAPLLALFIAGLAYSEALADALMALGGAAPAHRTLVVVACIAVLWTLFDLVSIVGNALFIALVNDTVPQALLGRFFGMFRIVSLAVGVAFFHYVFGGGLQADIGDVLLAIAAAYLLGFLVVCLRVREPAYPPPAAASGQRGLGRLRVTDQDDPRFYCLLFAAVGVAAVSVLAVNINSYNAISQFGVDRADFGNAVALTYCVSMLLALPLGWLADRTHPLRVGLVVLVLYCLSMLAAWLLVTDRASFLAGFVLHGVLAGAFLSGTAALLPTLLPRERFSELAAFSASVTAVLTVAFTLGLGLLLDWSGRDFRLIFLVAGLGAGLASCLWYGLLRAQRRRCSLRH